MNINEIYTKFAWGVQNSAKIKNKTKNPMGMIVDWA